MTLELAPDETIPVIDRPHRVEARYYAHSLDFLLIGAGGTGGFVAEALCRLMSGRPASITIVDHDVVERHNLLRQNFYPQEVGQPKSKALAHRLSQLYQRAIAYSTIPASAHYQELRPQLPRRPQIIITCVDNAQARLDIEQTITKYNNPWLIDAGNGDTWGQVLIGNTNDPDHAREGFRQGVCHALPTPLLQRPDLAYDPPDPGPRVDCAAALDLTDQDPTINQLMAALTIQTVRRLIAGTLTYMALYADQTTGQVSPTRTTPRNVARVFNADPEQMAQETPGFTY